LANACCAAAFCVPVILSGATLSKTDTQFMKMAAQVNMSEAHIGQMAQTHASAQSVKDFGKTLSDDHTTSYEGLSVLANKTGEEIPKALAKNATVTRLDHLKGKSFDRAFMQGEVQSHKTALAAFQKEADHGDNPDVKAWAQSMIPKLQGHLQTAENLEKQAK
jgi:putative membrane protein